MSDRVPVATEAEEGFVSALLTAPDRICPLLAGAPLPPQAWMIEDCRWVVEAAMRRWREREPVDPILIGSDLRGRVSPLRMMQLATLASVPSAAGDYLELVREAHNRRQVIDACQKAQSVATLATSSEALAVLSAVAASINRPDIEKVSTLRELLKNAITELENGERPKMIKTGWQCLDEISPVQAGDVVVIAAPAKGGKSTLALSYASNVAREGGNVLILSLEMTAGLVTTKLMSRQATVPLARLLHKDLQEEDIGKVGRAVHSMAGWKVEIRDDVQTLDQVVGAARLAHAKAPLTMLVVDYLQLVQGPQVKGSTREQEVAQISRTLRLLSLELGCVVVALSQLNEEGRLRESRAIGQDATAIWKVVDSDDDGHKTIQVVQRNGESPASCQLRFRGYISSFSEN